MEIDGRRLEAAIPGRQPRTLLAYLVLHRRRPVRREELIEILWPDAPPASPEGALSTIVSRLRSVVGRETVAGRSELRLALPADALIDFECALDAIECAEQALERGAWQDATSWADDALSVARRGFLADVEAGWAEDERRRLDEVHLRALECRAASGLALGGSHLSATERAARQLIEAAPYRETGHRFLMQALADRGCVAEALRVFDGVRVLLQEQLGVAPSAGLRTLHERLLNEPEPGAAREHDDPPAVPLRRTPRAGSAGGLPQPLALPPAFATRDGEEFVGRDEDFGRLWDLYEQARSGTGRVAFVHGEPGIGKTRLCRELACRAWRDGAVALYGRCDEEPLVSHQPFVEALGHYVAACPLAQLAAHVGLGSGELRRLIPELAERLPALAQPMHGDRDGERYRLFAAVVALLRRAAETSPVVLVLDDLHWSETSTLLLLRHLARHIRPTALLVLATYRDAEVQPGHPLRDTLADLGGDPGCERLALGALDVAAVGDLVRSHAGEQAPELVRMLYDESEGNPFFVGEILRHLTESGRLSADGQPHVHGRRLTDLGIPEGVDRVIGRRIARLGQRTQAVLATASVSGRTFEFAVLERLSGPEQDDLLDALDEAVHARLIEEMPDGAGRYSFTHALIRETVYAGLMQTRRALLHRRIAVALEEIHAADPAARSAELAHHFAHAGAPGDIAKAIAYATRAGETALAGLAYEQAAAHFRDAVRLLGGAEPPAQAARRCDLLIAQGEAERRAGDATYRRTLLDGARLAQQLDDPDRLARAALANNRGFFSAAADVDTERVAVLDGALAAHGVHDSATRASLLAQLAVELVPDPDWRRRSQLSDEALAMARRVGDPTTLARTLNQRYVALWGPRTLPERLANAREAGALAKGLDDHVLSFQCARFGAHAAMEDGNLELADRLLEDAREVAEQLEQPIIQWYYAVTRAKRESISAAPGAAEKLVRDAADLGQRIGQPDAALWRSIGLFVTRLLQGTLVWATSCPVDVARPAAETDTHIAPSRSAELLTVALRAATASETGHLTDARASFETLMCDDLVDLPHGWTALAVPAVAAVACGRLGDVRRARTLVVMLEPYAGRFVDAGPAWFGAVSHHLAGLATTLGELDDADARFAEGARTYAALGAGAWLTRLRLDWVRMLLARGDLGRARALLADVIATAQTDGLPELEHAAASLLGMAALGR